ncbi:MAG: TCR/Tet family MFS transporter [Bacteroidota bacterium]|nr:TCR/Tet family MFS transporter [Flavisolibacter sp.]MBD0296935.1 TCR/Tet family MFS transporter [Flavisolibacter sp.]MDQ3846291.1 TCR/Tet family MFS transporter [Bacteroidota bacterium]
MQVQHKGSSRPAAMSFIFFTLLIDVTGLGLIIPVMPKLIESLIHGDISAASQWGGWLTFSYAIMQFMCAPIIGNLSDQYGRRPVLLLSLLGFGVDYLFLALAPTIGWLFVGRIIAGITGASFTTASAYIADISTPENRAKNFGMIGGAFGLGFIIGPVIGGLLGSFGPRVPFLVAAGLSLLNALYGFFVLPESLSHEKRRKFQWKRANPVGSLLHLKKYPGIAGLIAALVFVYIAAHAVQSNWTFFTIKQFNWSEKLIGISLGVIGFLVAVVQAGLIRIVHPVLGNERSVYVGLAFYGLGLLLFAFATQTWMMFVFMIPYCLGGIAGPALQSIITGHVPPNEQGELQGALTSMISATSIIGPPLMTNLFAFFTRPGAPVHFAGAPFLLGALLMIGSTLIAYTTLKKEKHHSFIPDTSYELEK